MIKGGGSPSTGASSSLSVEDDVQSKGMDADVTEKEQNCCMTMDCKCLSRSDYNVPSDYIENSQNLALDRAKNITPQSDSSNQTPVNAKKRKNPSMENEDAICTRTRARYSLSSFTLDELETFLQETDDEDDEHKNVDDGEEYRKFLAAFVQGRDVDGNVAQEVENVDEEDEEDDADFIIEIEEALESDVDETILADSCRAGGKMVGSRQKRQTRLNKRKRANPWDSIDPSAFARPPLRPLVPITTSVAPSPHSSDPADCSASSNMFTPHQIGQLHCLIYEHVQLLVQVFALCVFEPSRHHVASQTEEMLLEVLHKRVEFLGKRSVPHPSFCFSPVPPSKSSGGQWFTGPSFTPVVRCDGLSIGSMNSFQTSEGPVWVPSVGGPIISVLDVAPLSLVGKFLNEVSAARKEYQVQCVGATGDAWSERKPLFPLPMATPFSQDEDPLASNAGMSSPSNMPPKKTLASAIVENSKKQSVAYVPKDIAKLAERFIPLFNSALYPHKPPPAPVASRFLFTEAEDELLALGLMEYNTDWKEIQRRFLPCKSENQIFVRQKNRCSSKAPENCIKAVRKVKIAPLTEEEITRIHEGLKTYKLDWRSIWQFVVPYRDPSLLHRQWRTAIGIQKSYKADDIQKVKRRLYESKRRFKDGGFSIPLNAPEEDPRIYDECGDDTGQDDGNDCSFLHEAFLADWRPKRPLPPGLHSFKPKGPNQHHGSSKPSKSMLFPPWYNSHRSKAEHLVKLAPGLPPVNLPSSVRVISQPVLEAHHGIVLRSCAETSGLARPPEAMKTSVGLERDHSQHRCVKEREDNDATCTPQLHPLLFHPIQGVQSHRRPKSRNTKTKLKRPSSSRASRYFHPLLVDNNAPEDEGSAPVSTNLELNIDSRNKQAISGERLDEVELEISSNLRTSKDKTETTSSGDYVVDPVRQNSNERNGIRGYAGTLAGISSYNNNATEDSSAGIIMEQEELSDSENEEESIEFEYEEMDDSENEDDLRIQT